MPDYPSKTSRTQEVQAFLAQGRQLRAQAERRARLLFALDATASREPTWALAARQQLAMFEATEQAGDLSVQLAWYGGLQNFDHSDWVTETAALRDRMMAVRCHAGPTQLCRVLRHALREHERAPLRAVLFIGDALEEEPDEVLDLAARCRLRKLPLFLFQEGGDPAVKVVFQKAARLTQGAFCHFDQQSAARLAELLGAVARYAAGGRRALEGRPDNGARLLLEQLQG